ncbi:MAG: tRNA adenosine(34) deaminase TadA [Firmicutes bacterium]|nr:tRNA adenosine(34) deaminase TadA [Bacillota bacterium]
MEEVLLEQQSEHRFMEEAIAEARKALELMEVPVGAVIVRDGIIVGRGHNLTETSKDPTAHAEIIAIREAAKTLGGWRLIGCKMYVTTEPCSMCAGAIVLSRIPELFVGTMNPKAGACGSLYNIVSDSRLNHRVQVTTGVMEDTCRQMMQEFFRRLKATREDK